MFPNCSRTDTGAAAESLDVEFQLGGAEDQPAGDASFDAVPGAFGVMFAPDHQRAADQIARVTRPPGTVALASWTPDGFAGEMFRVITQHGPAPGHRRARSSHIPSSPSMASTRDPDPHRSPPGRPRREHPNPCRPMQIGVIGASFTVQLPITGSAKDSAIRRAESRAPATDCSSG